LINISHNLSIADTEVTFHAIRAQGAGGQNVNKVSSAIHLRFDINASSLTDEFKQRLLAFKDQRISSEGVIVIKAQRYRSQEKNREEALQRLQALIKSALVTHKKRKPTRPSRASRERRIEQKVKHGRQKGLRRKIDY